MSNKSLLYLAVAVVVLGGIYLIMANNSVPVAKPEAVLASDTSAISDILVTNDQGNLHLKRTDAGWDIVEPFQFKASNSRVKQLLSRIANMTEELVVTNSPERQSEYGVDSTAIILTIVSEGDTSSILIGKAASGRAATYARKPGEDPVLVVKGSIRGALQRTPEDWRDLIIVHSNMDNMARFTTPEIELQREGEVSWFLSQPDTLYNLDADSKYARFLTRVPNMRATSFASAEDVEGVNFAKPSNWFEVETKAGELMRVTFYEDPNGDRAFAHLNGNKDATYIVSGSIYKQIFEDLKSTLLERLRRKVAQEESAKAAG